MILGQPDTAICNSCFPELAHLHDLAESYCNAKDIPGISFAALVEQYIFLHCSGWWRAQLVGASIGGSEPCRFRLDNVTHTTSNGSLLLCNLHIVHGKDLVEDGPGTVHNRVKVDLDFFPNLSPGDDMLYLLH